MLLSKMPAILAQPRRVKYFRSIEGIMPATTCYFAWGCFPYFSWEREPPRPYGSGRRKCRFTPSSLRNGSAVTAGGAALGAASRRPHPEEPLGAASRRTAEDQHRGLMVLPATRSIVRRRRCQRVARTRARRRAQLRSRSDDRLRIVRRRRIRAASP